jgi:hypothetical protein
MSRSETPPDPYTWIHKGQRRLLFQAVELAGRADFEDESERRELRSSAAAILRQLRAHARHEETYFRPLFERHLPDLAREMAFDHATLEEDLSRLEAMLEGVAAGPPGSRRASGLALYRELAAFLARYLWHLSVEESSLPRIWAMVPAAELEDAMARFRAARAPDEAMADLETMLPALSPGEREQLLLDIRAGSKEAYEAARNLARHTLHPAAWRRLDTDLTAGH